MKSLKLTKKISIFNLQNLLNVAVMILLIWLGSIIGFNFSKTGKLPLGLEKITFLASSISKEQIKPSAQLTGSPNAKDKSVDFNTFWEVWGYLERDYLEPEKLEADKMVHGAIAGMVASLGDPYTAYLPPEDNQRSGEDLAGSFYGVGIELGYIDGNLAAVTPLKESPAEKAGVQAGDLIIHVKDAKKGLDEDTTGWSLSKAVNNIRGGKGEPVVLTLFRPDDQEKGTFEVEIIRDEIVVKSVELDKRIVTEKNSIAGVVLDMRNNPGGFFDTSIKVASEFFKNGIVVSQKGKVQTQDFRAKGQARLVGVPTVVLVNKGSASAAEIVAGALKDNINAKLVGVKTFGKGTVQDRRELSNGGGIHITIGRWLMPKGEWIHHEGIPVDVEVKDNPDTQEDEVLLKGIESL